MEQGTIRLKTGLAEMLKGGVIMDVTTPEQAVIAENLYRLWFSLPQMYGITWWNAVDDCGAPGEPSVSGLFHRDMTPKASFFALDELLNNKWKTRLDAKTQEDGLIKFRGFKGDYRIVWEDDSGVSRSRTVHVE